MSLADRLSGQPRLLATKLFFPRPQADVVPRPRLVARLEDGLRRRLTLLSAPAGSGKTTLLGAWRAGSAGSRWPVAWLTLDPDDNDPGWFWTYVCAALGSAQPGAGDETRALLRASSSASREAIVTGLVNELAQVPRELALVLDDYHVIHARAVHDGVASLLEHLPAQVHLVLATRADPPLPLAKLRARADLAEIRAADLRFTLDEATAFLARAMQPDLAPEAISALAERTEGWAVGLRLAALALHGQADPERFVAGFAGSHRYLVDYLADEVLRHQPEHVHRFLLQTAILDRLTGPLCEAVTGRHDAGLLLEALERANLFVVALDDERRWYRYHQLFADVLRHHLDRAEPAHVPELHRRAAVWHEQHGFVGEAVHHALAAGDQQLAARLVEAAAQALVARGEMATLLNWVEPLPTDLVRDRPRLGLAHAWALAFTNQLEAAERRVEDIERALDLAAAPELAPEAVAVRAAIASGRRDSSRTIALSRQALAGLPPDHVHRGALALNLAYAQSERGDLRATREAFAETARIGEATHNLLVASIGLLNLGQLEAHQGSLRQALVWYRRVLALASERGSAALPIAGLASLGLGGVLCERNELESAERHLADAAERGRYLGGVFQFATDIALSRLQRARGDLAGALDALDRAETRLDQRQFPWRQARLEALRARLWLAQGDLPAVSEWARDCAVASAQSSWPTYLLERLTLVRVWLAQGQLSQALELLAELRAALGGGRTGNSIELLLLEALAHHERGVPEAVPIVARALALAEPEGHVRLFADEGAPMARLLAGVYAAQRRGESGPLTRLSRDYLARLLAASQAADGAPVPGPSAAGSLVEPLSERELEVLRLIAAGGSNADIARELVVELGTVKTHINNLYRKLDVHSRTQALARAGQLGLLAAR